ncbi:MAG: helix-turn-helix domain-containing protein [archaeon]
MIAEFDVETNAMESAFKRSPGLEASIVQQTARAPNTLDVVMNAFHDDFSAFEAGLDADDTVEEWIRLSDADDWCRYRVTLTERGRELMTYPSWSEEGAVFLDGTRNRDHWRFRIQFPDEESFQRYVAYREERSVDFRPKLLARTEPVTNTERFGLTAGQRQSLVHAHKNGFFQVPRACTLEELAADYEVTHQALSERLRRGMGALVEATLR